MPAPLGFLRSLTQRQGPLTLRAAQEEDYEAIQEVLDTSSRAYSGLGGAMREALQQEFALTAWQGGRLAGFVLAHQQGPETAWIHGLGLAADVAPGTVGAALLHKLGQTLHENGVKWIGYMDEYRLAWAGRLLEQAGFRPHTRVVSYETPLHAPPTSGNAQVTVRPATQDDIPTIARIDQAAFGPLWAYREQVFHAVLGAVVCFDVAEHHGESVGYILCTVYHRDHAHVVRLAVVPLWQKQGVGARLLAQAYDYLRAQGIQWISLNTQAENTRSQHLYHWFGFRPTGDEMEVWAKEVSG